MSAPKTKSRAKARRGRPPLSVFEVEAARTSILAAAATVYNRTGQDTPVQEILEEAQVSRATFYKLFSSKEALQKSLLEFSIDLMLGAIEDAARAEDDPRDRVDAAIRTFLDFHAQQPGVYRILLASALHPGTPIHQVRMQAQERFAALFADEVARAGRPPVDPLILHGLVAAIEGVSIHILRGGGTVDEQMLERARAVLVRLIAATLAENEDPVPPLPRP